MTLSVFLVCPGKDANGVEIEPKCEFNIGTVWWVCSVFLFDIALMYAVNSHPKPYPYELKCRSPEAEMLIRSIADSDEVKQWRSGNGVEL
jgi:hypothetical protein